MAVSPTQRRLVDKQFTELPDNTQCYQVEDGTIFYFKWSKPQRLYVKNESNDQVQVELPLGTIQQVSACGNAVYFKTDQMKIYKATLADCAVSVTFAGLVQPGETITSTSLCSIKVADAMKRYSRLCDDTETGILASSYDRFRGITAHTIHRGNVVFAKTSDVVEKEISRRAQNAIQLWVPPSAGIAFAQDSSKFIYIPVGQELHVLNTRTMEALPPLSLGEPTKLSNVVIVGVREGGITLTAEKSGTNYLVTAKLPEEYFDFDSKEKKISTQPRVATAVRKAFDAEAQKWVEQKYHAASERWVPEIQAAIIHTEGSEGSNPPSDEWSGEMPAELPPPYIPDRPAYTKMLEKREDTHGNVPAEKLWQREMTSTINELLDKNMELSDAIERAKAVRSENTNFDAVSAFTDNNNALAMEIAQLETDNEEIKNNLDRSAVLNTEIEAANAQLSEERELLATEEEEEKHQLALQQELCEEKKRLESLNIEKEKSTAEVVKANKELKERLAQMLKENKDLVSAIAGSEKSREILAVNEQLLKEINTN